ncbi:MAG TPA: hypothetical protein VNK04_15670 [Gemmataceae bacterium]|nr:hypothetical protein [Gemmataceae bacterium]
MSASGALLHGFAYGEHLEGISQRSLGYRLLAPAEPQPWSAEVEALARRLQAAPYPDHWPPTDLFCSVLLADGQRLVAVARYGLADHTPSHRRGGLELIGVVGPASLDVPSALAIYRWLSKRRAAADDLHTLGGRFPLAEVVSQAGPAPPPSASDPVPVLPIRLWQEGVLLFAATAPSDPDHRLGLLEQGAERNWQWIPLAGADFPWQTYAQRGPVIAWTPHLAGVALKLDRRPADELARPARRRPWLLSAPGLLTLFVILLLGANLGAMLWVVSALKDRPIAGADGPPATPPAGLLPRDSPPKVEATADDSRERFAEALYALLIDQGGRREWGQTEAQLLAHYEQAAQKNKDLRLKDGNTRGKLAVGAARVLAQRSADRIEEMVRKALSGKGFDPKLVDLACEFVHRQLTAETTK